MLESKLFTLLKVVETGNYSQAAKALNLTQPAISQHIKSLEQEFNIKIFERAGNTFVLTREGEKVASAARAIFSLYNNLQNDLAIGTNGNIALSIGITHTVESNRVSEVIAKYASKHSGTSIKLITDNQQKLKEKLKNYELDFAIIDGKVVDSNIKHMLLDMDSLVLVVSPNHKLAKNNIVTIDDIKKEKMILRLPSSGTINLFKAALENNNMDIEEFQVILKVDNIATIKNLIRLEYGVSVLPKSACVDEIREKRLISLPIENLSMNREINLVYNNSFAYPELLNEIIKIYNEM